MFKAFLCLMISLPLAVSCFDDSELWEAIDQLEMRVDSLQNNLNAQMQVVSDMLSGKKNMAISSCVMNADSSYVVTLTNGVSFTVLPQNASLSSLVSVVTVEGKRCWAMYDESGALTPIHDSKGAPIPVDMAISVKIVDGKYYLVVGDNEIETCYDTEDLVQVFNSCEVHKDASGNVYAMTFDFGGGMKVTVAVDGYKGVLFKISTINTDVLSEYFIGYGASQTFLMDVNGVVDYVMQIPDGWRVTEKVEQLTGDVYVTITAPTREAVEMGAGVPGGDLKVVSVVEGGKAVVTKLTLSTDPFKVFNVSSLRAVVQTYTGIQKFVYGLTLISEFEPSQVIAEVNRILTTTAELPEGYFISETALDKSHEEIYPELQEGGAYMFWAVPAVYSEGDDESTAGFSASEDMLRTYSLVPMFVQMKVSDVTLLDAKLDLKVVGAAQLYAGLFPKTASVIDEIVYQINNGALEKIEDAELLSYEGPASEFPHKEFPHYMEPNTSYVAWVVPVEEDKKEYFVTDVTYQEFTTLDIVAGGTLKAELAAPVATSSSASINVSCEEAAMIYYAYLDDSIGSRNQNFGNETKWNVMQSAATFTSVRGTSVEAVIDELMPETTVWLYAVPVSHQGLLGEVVCKSVTTSGVTFNDMSVKVEPVEVLSDEASFRISVTGGTAEDYIYWVGRTANDFWVNKCGKRVETAQKFMAANPDADVIADVMKMNGPVSAEGILKVTGLTINKEHVILVMAKDAEGNYSPAGVYTFNTKAVNLGAAFVSEGSEKWNTTKKWIEDNIVWHKETFKGTSGQGQGYAYYSFDIKIPQELTASISTSYPDHFNPESADLSETIIAFEEYCAESRDVTTLSSVELKDEDRPQFDLVDDYGRMHNASNYVNVSDHYVHGCPGYGRATYFSSAGHTETSCYMWDGVCPNYEEAKKKIANKLSVEYWKAWVVDEWSWVYNNDPTHDYSRVFTDEEAISDFAMRMVNFYKPYYQDMEPIVFVNDGSALKFINSYAVGVDEEGNVIDKVFVVLKDDSGNYYAPMIIDVPNYFK